MFDWFARSVISKVIADLRGNDISVDAFIRQEVLVVLRLWIGMTPLIAVCFGHLRFTCLHGWAGAIRG